MPEVSLQNLYSIHVHLYIHEIAYCSVFNQKHLSEK